MPDPLFLQPGEKSLKNFLNSIHSEADEDWMIVIGVFISQWLEGANTFSIPTSGSTGKRKLIEVSRDDLILSAKYTSSYLGLKKGMNALVCLPTEFIAGKMMLVRAMETGMNMVLVKPSGNPLEFIDAQIDFAAFTEHQLIQILGDESSKRKFSNIQKVIVGGGSVRRENELSGFGIDIYQTYGMTETLSHIAMRRLGTGEESLELISNDFKISVDDRSCLNIRSPYKHARQIQTNDVVDIPSENRFVWKSRFDNVVNSGGIKIFPEEIERKLAEVMDQPFFAAGISDKLLGEKLILIIEGTESSRNEILGKMNKMIAGKERPREIFFINRFIYTQTGKVRRKATVEKLFGTQGKN